MKTIYLDNAATSRTPEVVIEAMNGYYRNYRASVHRGLYKEAERATAAFEQARKSVAKLIGAEAKEVVFTKGATESLNMVAQRLCETLREGDEIILTEMEHHANIVPWQEMAKRYGLGIKWVPVKNDFTLDMDAYRSLLSKRTKVVAFTHVSNVLGTVNPVEEMTGLAHAAGAIVVVDAAQSVPHMKIDVKKIGCDFLVFSGHKACGPTGIGVLYGMKERLDNMKPFLYGGHMIRSVTKEGAEWADIPAKFEAGTANIAGVIGLGAAAKHLEKTYDLARDEALNAYGIEKLSAMEGVTVIGPGTDRIGALSFTVDGMHPHDVSELLAREGVAVRGGHHCAMPLMKALGLEGTTRASFSHETTKEDVDALVEAIKKAQKVFGYEK